MVAASPAIGVLALQGAFAEHRVALNMLGAHVREIRTPADLSVEPLDGLVIPGGESTTISRLLSTGGLAEPIGDLLRGGLPAFGTCAGMIVLSHEILDGRADQTPFDAIDITVRRNAYGRQIDSFEAAVDIGALGTDGASDFPAVFIRAPGIERVGSAVQVLASHDRRPVLLRQGPVLVSSFHPELTEDTRVHAYFLRSVVAGAVPDE